MFAVAEMTPELLREFQEQQIIVAHNKDEVWQEEKRISTDNLKRATWASLRLEDLIGKWKGYGTPWSVLKGLRVLDLASGSGYTKDFSGNIWYPHFARLCAVNGAYVTAIDCRRQRGHDQTLFAWAAEDLVEAVLNGGLQHLPILQGRHFDLINSSNFVGLNFYPKLPQQVARYGLGLEAYENRLLHQAGELLAEGGIMTLGTFDENFNFLYYTKMENTTLLSK